jgi:hypothetical protein
VTTTGGASGTTLGFDSAVLFSGRGDLDGTAAALGAQSTPVDSLSSRRVPFRPSPNPMSMSPFFDLEQLPPILKTVKT